MSKNKKIQAIIPLYHPHVGGMEVNSKHTYKYLAERGWDIKIITPNVPHEQSQLPENEIIDGVAVNRLPVAQFGYNPFGLGIQYFEQHLIVFHQYRLNPALLVALVEFVLKVFGKKRNTVILSAHGYFSAAPESLPQGFKFKVMYLLEKLFAFCVLQFVVDGIRAVSETEKRGLIQKGFPARKITVISNGLDEQAFDPAVGYKASGETSYLVQSLHPYILQVSRIDKVKNIQTVLRALPLLKNPITYVIAGNIALDGREYYEELKELVRQLGVEERVKFLGPVSGHDKFYLMRRAMAVVQLSISEGFGNAVFEAMSQGAICIVSKGNALEDIVEHERNGYNIDMYDFQSLAKIIDTIYEHLGTEKIQAMKQQAIKKTRDRSWRDVALDVEHFYLGLLGTV